MRSLNKFIRFVGTYYEDFHFSKQRPQPEARRVRGISEEVYRSQYTKLSNVSKIYWF